jgi:hypothetical protein
MRNRISRATLASNAGLPAQAAEICQRILATREDMHPWLSTNPDLSPEVWRILWGKNRPEAEVAQGLVSRELGATQRNVVITKENRIGILRAFVQHNVLTAEEQQLLSGKTNAAAALIEQEWLEPSLRKPLARRIGGLVLLKEMTLASRGVFTDEELGELLASYPTWISSHVDLRRGAKDRNRYLRILFGRHPRLVDVVLDAEIPEGRHLQDLLTSAAGSAYLSPPAAERIAGITDDRCTLTREALEERHYCLLALLNNPRCPQRVIDAVAATSAKCGGNGDWMLRDAATRRREKPELVEEFEEISDPVTLDWVVRRSLPYRGDESSRPARPVELLALLKNPHLTPAQTTFIKDAIRRDVEEELIRQDEVVVTKLYDGVVPRQGTAQVGHRQAGTPMHIQEAFDFAAARLGTDPVRWETLIGLADDYDGTFEELVALSESI